MGKSTLMIFREYKWCDHVLGAERHFLLVISIVLWSLSSLKSYQRISTYRPAKSIKYFYIENMQRVTDYKMFFIYTPGKLKSSCVFVNTKQLHVKTELIIIDLVERVFWPDRLSCTRLRFSRDLRDKEVSSQGKLWGIFTIISFQFNFN